MRSIKLNGKCLLLTAILQEHVPLTVRHVQVVLFVLHAKPDFSLLVALAQVRTRTKLMKLGNESFIQ